MVASRELHGAVHGAVGEAARLGGSRGVCGSVSAPAARRFSGGPAPPAPRRWAVACAGGRSLLCARSFIRPDYRYILLVLCPYWCVWF